MSFTILQEYNELPSMIFFSTENTYSKLLLGRFFFNCQPIYIFAAHFGTNLAPYFAKKIFCLWLKEIEGICEKPLSETRNYTLVV